MSFVFSFRLLLCSPILCLVFFTFVVGCICLSLWVIFLSMKRLLTVCCHAGDLIWHGKTFPYEIFLSFNTLIGFWKKIFATADSLSLCVVCYLINQKFNVSSCVGAIFDTISIISKKYHAFSWYLRKTVGSYYFLYSFYIVWNSERAVCRGI